MMKKSMPKSGKKAPPMQEMKDKALLRKMTKKKDMKRPK